MSPSVSSLRGPLWGFSVYFSAYLTIQHSRSVLSFSIFYSKSVLFLSPPIADLSLSILHQVVGRIFLCYFGMSCFVCIAWSRSDTFLWIFLLLPISFDLILSLVWTNLFALSFLHLFFPLGFCLFHL